MKGDPLVSIRCTVYNHEPFLRQCLDGFVMQKTTFPFEAIVHDDASTDGSAAIIREYAEKYPDIIKPIYETENQYQKGKVEAIIIAATHPNSKYIATCEGDDYWTDPNKLQLQIDFLESHPDYYMTCHAFKVYYADTNEFVEHDFPDRLPLDSYKGKYFCTPTIDDFFRSPWFTQVLTIVRRRVVFNSYQNLRRYERVFDYVLCYYMLRTGKCALFKDVMGVYRKQGGGIFTGANATKWSENALEDYYVLYQVENEKAAINLICRMYVELCYPYLCLGEFKKAFELTRRHFLVMPFKHSMRSFFKVISLAMNRVKRLIFRTKDSEVR